MNETKISWTQVSWNPVHGCHKVSDGCRYCYAETLSLRYGFTKKPWTKPNSAENVQLKPHKLREPYKLKEPTRIFVNSMSDCFHELVPDEYLTAIFKVMNDLPQHTFQILTKRPERAAAWPGPWTPNIWMGTSVEDWRVVKRIDHLRRCRAHTRFLSCEPLIGPLGPVDLDGIHWVIVGGESGAHLSEAEQARKRGIDPTTVNPRWMRHEWAREIRDACVVQGAAFFYKQDSGIRTEMRTQLIEADGRLTEWAEYPTHLDLQPALF